MMNRGEYGRVNIYRGVADGCTPEVCARRQTVNMRVVPILLESILGFSYRNSIAFANHKLCAILIFFCQNNFSQVSLWSKLLKCSIGQDVEF